SGSAIEAKGQVTVAGTGRVRLHATERARPTITGKGIRVQGASIYGQAVALDAQAGDIDLRATADTLQMTSPTGIRSQLTATGNVSLHAEGMLGLWDVDVSAGGSFAGTSVAGDITTVRNSVVAGDALILAAQGAQNHWNGVFDGGAFYMLTRAGNIDLKDTR